jgi:predicted DNA-binding transcriptional regulator AlpA
MGASKSAIAPRLPIRRGLGEAEAALYIGLGASKFRELVIAGTMPRPRLIGTRRVWDIDDIDAAFRALPVEGEAAQDRNPWHED